MKRLVTVLALVLTGCVSDGKKVENATGVECRADNLVLEIAKFIDLLMG